MSPKEPAPGRPGCDSIPHRLELVSFVLLAATPDNVTIARVTKRPKFGAQPFSFTQL